MKLVKRFATIMANSYILILSNINRWKRNVTFSNISNVLRHDITTVIKLPWKSSAGSNTNINGSTYMNGARVSDVTPTFSGFAPAMLAPT